MKINLFLTFVTLLTAASGFAQTPNVPERVYQVGGAEGATAPKCTPAVPSYTDEARKAHLQGNVTMDVIVHKDGTVELIKMTAKLGYGLDEEAEKSLKLWTCIPGQVNGQPVAVQVKTEIEFHLK